MNTSSRFALSLVNALIICAAAVRGDESRSNAPLPSHAKTTVNERFDNAGDVLPAGAILRLGTIRLRNAQGVEGVAFSPDGKLLASCGWDDSIRLWDVATSAPVKRLIADGGDGTFGVAFSSDGARLASVSEQGLVRLWDVPAGRQLWKVLGHLEPGALPRKFGTRVYGVAFSPDGAMLATGGSDPTIKLWDVATGKKLREFDTQSDGGDARPVTFSPNGKLLAAGCPNGNIFVWNPANGKLIHQIKKASERNVASIVFTRDGRELISSGIHFERTAKNSANAVSDIRAWNASTGAPAPAFGTPPDVDGETTLAISSDGKKLYSAHHDRIIFWDVDSRSPTRYLRFNRAQLGGRTHGLAVSPNGKLLASKAHWNQHNKVWLWDLEQQKEMFAQGDAHSSGVLAVRYSPDGSKIATGSADNTVRLWDANTGKHLRLVDEGTGWVRYVDFTPDGTQLLLGRETSEPHEFAFKGELKVFNVADGRLITKMPAPGRVMCGALSPDGNVVAAAIDIEGQEAAGDPFAGPGAGGTKIIVREATTGKQLAAFDRGSADAGKLMFSADGAELTLLSENASVRRWRWRESKELPVPIPQLKPVQQRYYKATCGPSATTCVFAGFAREGDNATGRLSIVDLKNNKITWEKEFDDLRPWELAISADSKLLAACLQPLSRAKTGARLTIWSLHDGQELISFNLIDDPVRSLAFSPDGSHLVSGMELGDALVWDIATAREKLK